MPLHATPNAYQRAYPAYDETPKAVIAAVAYGLALRLCADDPEAAAALLRAEWALLHRHGVVPQPPRQPPRGREAPRSTTRHQHIRVGQRLIHWDGSRGYVALNSKGKSIYGPGEPFLVEWLGLDGAVEDGAYYTLEDLEREGMTFGRGVMPWAR